MVDSGIFISSLPVSEGKSGFTHLPASSLAPHSPAQPIKCYPAKPSSTTLTFSVTSFFFFSFFLPWEEIPQGICGSTTTYISNLRPRRLIDPATQECGPILSAVNVQGFPTPHLSPASFLFSSPKPAYSAGPEPAKALSLRLSAETLESSLLRW